MADGSAPYGILLSSFFDGSTGMRLQSLGASGKDALLLGAFFTANEWANMIGLYELSLSKIARKLPVLKGKTLARALELLDQERFAHYDGETEFVWVREMARIRLGIVAGEKVANPRRLVAAQNLYQRVPLNPFLGPFYDRYRIELALKHRRGSPPTPPTFGEPLAERFTKPVAEHFGEPFGERASGTSTYRDQVPGTSDQGNSDQGSIKAAAAPRALRAVENPNDNVEVITSLVAKELLPLGICDDELVEATKSACAVRRIAYDGPTVRKAVDSALVRAKLPMAKAGLR